MVTRATYGQYLNPSRTNYIIARYLLLAVIYGMMRNLLSRPKLELEGKQLYIVQYVNYIFFLPIACGGIISDFFPKRYLHVIFYRLLISTPVDLLMAFCAIITDVNVAIVIKTTAEIIEPLAYVDMTCVWALAMDQFSDPNGKEDVLQFIQWRLVLRPIAYAFGYVIIDLMYMRMSCEGNNTCEIIIISLITILNVAQAFVIYLGIKHFIEYHPNVSYIKQSVPCLYNAFVNWIKKRRSEPKPSWLDYADERYDRLLVEYLKRFLIATLTCTLVSILEMICSTDDNKRNDLLKKMKFSSSLYGHDSNIFYDIVLKPLLTLFIFAPMIWLVERPLKKTKFWYPYERIMTGVYIIIISTGITFFIAIMNRSDPFLKFKPREVNVKIFSNMDCPSSLKFSRFVDEPVFVNTRSSLTLPGIKIDGYMQTIEVTIKGRCFEESTFRSSLIEQELMIIVFKMRGDNIIFDAFSKKQIYTESNSPILNIIGADITDRISVQDWLGLKHAVPPTFDIIAGIQIPNAKQRVISMDAQLVKLWKNDERILALDLKLGAEYTIMVTEGRKALVIIDVKPNTINAFWYFLTCALEIFGTYFLKTGVYMYLHISPPKILRATTYSVSNELYYLFEIAILWTHRLIPPEYPFLVTIIVLLLFTVFLSFYSKEVNHLFSKSDSEM